MAKVILSPNDKFVSIGARMFAEITGTRADETIELASNGRATFDPSFNRGGDTIRIKGAVADYFASLSGSNVVITSANGAEITIPIGSAGMTLQFNDLSGVLLYDGMPKFNGKAIGTVPVALSNSDLPPVPIVVLAGQSNAEITTMPVRIYSALAQQGGAFEFVHLAVGGTSLFGNAGRDWDPASRDELLDQLISQVNTAIANVQLAGRDPVVSMLWVQGETDEAQPTQEYLEQLTDFIQFFRDATGQPQAQIVISSVRSEGTVRNAQLQAGDTLANVDAIDALAAETVDGVHYAPSSANRIADEFLGLTEPVTPYHPGYRNLLPEITVVEDANEVHVTSVFYGPLIFEAVEDGRRHVVEAGQATDRIELGAGDDWVNTWDGDDYIATGAGGDFINAGAGKKTVFAGEGNDTVWSGTGDDQIWMGAGNDLALGRAGNDIIHGEGGTDSITGNAGADVLFGGSDADIFKYVSANDSTATSTDRIADFEVALDRIDLAEIGTLTFIGRAGFSGTGQVRYETDGDTTMIYANISGDLEADLVIALTGNIDLSGANFILG